MNTQAPENKDPGKIKQSNNQPSWLVLMPPKRRHLIDKSLILSILLDTSVKIKYKQLIMESSYTYYPYTLSMPLPSMHDTQPDHYLAESLIVKVFIRRSHINELELEGLH